MVMYAEYAFGEGRLRWRWSDLPVPRDLEEMHRYLERAHKTWRRCLDALTDSDFPLPRKTDWGELWPTERIVWEMIARDVYHEAQIRTTRAFYRTSHPRAGPV